MDLDPHKYKNALPYGKNGSAERNLYRAENARLKDLLKQDLFTHHEVRGPVGEWVFNKAWEDGHAADVSEVIWNFGELMELVKLAVSHGTQS